MEEILASIRRIISEDEPPAEEIPVAEAAPPPPPEPQPEPEPAPEPEPVHFDEPPVMEEEEDEVLELTDVVEEPEPLAMSDIEIVAPPPMVELRAEPPPLPPQEPLVGAPASSHAASAFEALERTVLMPAAGRTLEDVVREMLRPMLKAWLDEHLPGIVEAQVQAEVDRIARLRR